MNKQSNQDLGNLTNWVNANKICRNINKTEVFLFKSSRKLTNVLLKMKLNGKIDEKLNWKQQISDIAIKLNRANAILSKLKTLSTEKL